MLTLNVIDCQTFFGFELKLNSYTAILNGLYEVHPAERHFYKLPKSPTDLGLLKNSLTHQTIYSIN